MEMEGEKNTVCVTGGTGFIASWLVMKLLQRGYFVRATVRSDSTGANKDTSHLTNLPGASTRLKILNADLNDPDSFKTAVHGCTGVFHVAHPMDSHNKESPDAVTKRSVKGLLGVLKSCLDSKTVKRFVYTSSAVTLLNNDDRDETVIDENSWCDVDELDGDDSEKNIKSCYVVSKVVTEKTALEFGQRHGLEVVSLVLPLVVGPFICPSMPSSVYIFLGLILGKRDDYKYLFESYTMVHIDDATNALIFLLEDPNAEGRYICSSMVMTITSLFEYISEKYPEFELPSKEILDKFKSDNKVSFSSMKLLKSGFEFKYGIDEMLDGAISCCKAKGIL